MFGEPECDGNDDRGEKMMICAILERALAGENMLRDQMKTIVTPRSKFV